MIVELQYQASDASGRFQEDGTLSRRSAFAGWTGFESKSKTLGIVGGESGRGSKEDITVVEISTAFGRTLGLVQGQKVGIKLHLDPPLAHTIHIEPLTPSDWESMFALYLEWK